MRGVLLRITTAMLYELALPTSCHCLACKRCIAAQAPVAIQKPKTLVHHGDERSDPFYWLRDDDRKDPEILGYIKAENEYTAAALAPTEALQAQLFAEMRGRIQETDRSVAVRRDGFYYYSRTLEGKQYSIHCRRPVPEGAGSETEISQMDERCAPRGTVLSRQRAPAARLNSRVSSSAAILVTHAAMQGRSCQLHSFAQLMCVCCLSLTTNVASRSSLSK